MKQGTKVLVQEYFELNCIPVYVGQVLTIEFFELNGWCYISERSFKHYFKVINDDPKYTNFLYELNKLTDNE